MSAANIRLQDESTLSAVPIPAKESWFGFRAGFERLSDQTRNLYGSAGIVMIRPKFMRQSNVKEFACERLYFLLVKSVSLSRIPGFPFFFFSFPVLSFSI